MAFDVMSVDHETENAIFACPDQMQQLDMVVAPYPHKEAEPFGARPVWRRARQVDHVGHGFAPFQHDIIIDFWIAQEIDATLDI